MARARARKDNGATLGFETTLVGRGDKLRGHMDAAEYKHVVLGLIFLKYVSTRSKRAGRRCSRRPSRR